MDIGSRGLAEVNLIIPQGTSLTFDINHFDDSGAAVSHLGSTIKMAFQTRDRQTTIDLSECCEGTATGVRVSIPAAAITSALVRKRIVWDMIVAMDGGDTIRMAYGNVTVIDSYAEDE